MKLQKEYPPSWFQLPEASTAHSVHWGINPLLKSTTYFSQAPIPSLKSPNCPNLPFQTILPQILFFFCESLKSQLRQRKTFLFINFFVKCFFLNCNLLLHTRLNSHYKACCKKKKHTKIKRNRKSLQKEPTVNRCLLTLDLKSFRLQVKGKHSIDREFQGLAVQGKKLLTYTTL